MTGHIGTSTPKFVPPRWGRPPFDPTQTGLCKFGCVWSSLIDEFYDDNPVLIADDLVEVVPRCFFLLFSAFVFDSVLLLNALSEDVAIGRLILPWMISLRLNLCASLSIVPSELLILELLSQS